MREEMVQAERRLRDEYTEALQGEAEMRERGDVAAAEGRAGLTGSIEEDRAVLSEALTKLEQDLAAETEARKEFVYLYLQFLLGSETTEDFLRKHGFIGDPMNVGDPGDQSPMNHLHDEMTLVLYCNYYIYIFAF